MQPLYPSELQEIILAQGVRVLRLPCHKSGGQGIGVGLGRKDQLVQHALMEGG